MSVLLCSQALPAAATFGMVHAVNRAVVRADRLLDVNSDHVAVDQAATIGSGAVTSAGPCSAKLAAHAHTIDWSACTARQ